MSVQVWVVLSTFQCYTYLAFRPSERTESPIALGGRTTTTTTAPESVGAIINTWIPYIILPCLRGNNIQLKIPATILGVVCSIQMHNASDHNTNRCLCTHTHTNPHQTVSPSSAATSVTSHVIACSRVGGKNRLAYKRSRLSTIVGVVVVCSCHIGRNEFRMPYYLHTALYCGSVCVCVSNFMCVFMTMCTRAWVSVCSCKCLIAAQTSYWWALTHTHACCIRSCLRLCSTGDTSLPGVRGYSGLYVLNYIYD